MSAGIERIKTGIPGLDELFYGGIPKRNIVLLSGGPGTGKTIFSQQYLYYGLQQNEPGVLVTLEEHPVQVRRNMSTFGWEVRKYEENGTFAIVDAFTGGIGESAKREKYIVKSVDEVTELVDVIRQAIKDIRAERVAIDSVSTLYLTKPAMARGVLMQLKRVLSGLGTTALLVSQVSVTERGFGGPGVEHAVDGILRLDLDEIEGELIRSLIIWKMRGTKHDLHRRPFEITDRGIVVYPNKTIRTRGEAIRIVEQSNQGGEENE
ncbi:KaiC domain-containing protein [archaeon]|jgi:KaiC domain protein|nr:KaiC domain-containing protein [archaeon]NHV06076.1 KaiC domain-containing protein [Nitrososphaerota archaeon]